MNSETVLFIITIGNFLVLLWSANRSARKDKYEELSGLVTTLQEQIRIEREARENLQEELNTERKQRMRIETWARTLVRQLEDNHITPAPFIED